LAKVASHFATLKVGNICHHIFELSCYKIPWPSEACWALNDNKRPFTTNIA